MAKQTITPAADQAPPAAAPTPPLPADSLAAIAAELAAIRAENMEMKSRLAATESRTAMLQSYPPGPGAFENVPPAAPNTLPDDVAAICRTINPATGKPSRGRSDDPKDKLFLVRLPGHKSLVVYEEKHYHLDKLPVWARDQAEARWLFDHYSGVCHTLQQYQIEESPAA